MAESKIVEIIKDRLYWVSDKNPPLNYPNAFFFNVDSDLVYEPFFSDFGPLDLGKTYRYVTELKKLLLDPAYSKAKFFHHTSQDNAKRANAACLMGIFQVIILGRTAEEAWAPFSKLEPSILEYKDASYADSPYRCTILDCLRGLEYAIKLGWFDMIKFNLRDYEFYSKVENGDLNWIIPGKLLAFSGPSEKSNDPDGYKRFTPEDYVPIFRKYGVTMVVRLNKKQYDEERFTKNGIKHRDLYFLDGSCPNDEIIARFLEICEQQNGAIAVHCKAGLGRTGSLIAAYAMKHYKFNARDFIGYIRLCRPGSILGPQQQFLIDKEQDFHMMNQPSIKNNPPSKNLQEFEERFGLSKEFKSFEMTESQVISIGKDQGEPGQAERLLMARSLTEKRVKGCQEIANGEENEMNPNNTRMPRPIYKETIYDFDMAY